MGRTWTEEEKQAASERMKENHEAKKLVSKTRRTPASDQRDITAVHDTPKGYRDRWVNDNYGRVDKFKSFGYEHVEQAQVGSSNVDGTHSEAGVISRDMGKGVTAYLMRQEESNFNLDQAEKQRLVDESEDGMRKDIKSTDIQSEDDRYGKVTIGNK